MFLVLDGSVSILSQAMPEEDAGSVPLDWSTVKLELHAMQTSLDAIKELAHVPSSTELSGASAHAACGIAETLFTHWS